MNYEAVLAKVAATPHIKLFDFDAKPLVSEVLSAFESVCSGELALFNGFDEEALFVSGIIDYGDDPLISAQYIDKLPAADRARGLRPTRFGKSTPVLLDLIKRVTSFGGRVRLSKLPARTSVPMHSHKYKEFIVHIPIVTHTDVLMSAKINGVESLRHYQVGEAWQFNAWHEHAVYNHSDIDRYHIWCGFRTSHNGQYNERLFSLVDQALKA